MTRWGWALDVFEATYWQKYCQCGHLGEVEQVPKCDQMDAVELVAKCDQMDAVELVPELVRFGVALKMLHDVALKLWHELEVELGVTQNRPVPMAK